MQVLVNGKQICSTVPTYAKMDNNGKNEVAHYSIREMSLCEPHAQLKKGDALTIKSDYDVEKYPQYVAIQYITHRTEVTNVFRRRQSNTGHMETVAAMLSVVLGLPADFDLAKL
jgi:hypothetical protein